MSPVFTSQEMIAMGLGHLLPDKPQRKPRTIREHAQATIVPDADPRVLSLVVELPLDVRNEANGGRHWKAIAGRRRAARNAVAAYLKLCRLPPLPARVHLWRVAPRQLDFDGLVSSLKSVVDGVADVYGEDDKSSRYQWAYDQITAKRRAVRIQIETITQPGEPQWLAGPAQSSCR